VDDLQGFPAFAHHRWQDHCGEVALIFWLLIKSVRVSPTGNADDAAVVAGRPTGDLPAGDETPRALTGV
jgi:hypothetical protein